MENLTVCFGHERSAREIRDLARENFRRIGENYGSAIKTASMSWEQLRPHLTFRWAAEALPAAAAAADDGALGRVVAVGHFGNFELYARAHHFIKGFTPAATYRGLRQPSLNRLLQSLRQRSGCLFFERRTESDALKQAMNEQRLLLGFLADQHAGPGGLWLPFFGRECSTSAAPALFALRYHAPLCTAICYRTGLARWEIEFGPDIPMRLDGRLRSAAEITLEINRAFEAAVRRDPANWFWVHKRWKPKPRRVSAAGSTAPRPTTDVRADGS